MRTVRRYMWRRVICAQVLKVGVRPSSEKGVFEFACLAPEIDKLRTLIPPSRPNA